MSTFRYSAEQWHSIEALIECDREAAEAVRNKLEGAISYYHEQRDIAHLMAGSTAQRKAWENVLNAAEALQTALANVEDWTPPEFGKHSAEQVVRDNEVRKKVADTLGLVEETAKWNRAAYADQAKKSRGRSRPDRDLLLRSSFDIWTTDLRRALGITRSTKDSQVTGPLLAFVRAALMPVLGEEFPKGEAFRSAVDREKKRRDQELKRANGKLKSKSNFKIPLAIAS